MLLDVRIESNIIRTVVVVVLQVYCPRAAIEL